MLAVLGALLGCASDPTLTTQNGCLVVARHGYANSLSVDSALTHINALREFPSIDHFLSLSVETPSELARLAVERLIIEPIESRPPQTSCIAIAQGKRSCYIDVSALTAAGFVAAVVVGDKAVDEKTIATALETAARTGTLACRHGGAYPRLFSLRCIRNYCLSS